MGTIQSFGNWKPEIHEMPDQQTRLKSGKSSKTTPTSIDKEKQTGVFPSSKAKPYSTTLESCTCGDFLVRKLPCKHMYRLAIELGKLNEPAKTGTNKNLQISLKDAVAALEHLSDDFQKSLMQCLWNDKGAVHIWEAADDMELLRTCPLVEIQELPDDAIEGNAIAFIISENFRSSRRKAYIYLKRKFDWEYFTGGKYPYGSESGPMELKMSVGENGTVESEWNNDKKYYFPDDEITELLTLYGHNRCLNGFDLLPNDVY